MFDGGRSGVRKIKPSLVLKNIKFPLKYRTS